MRVEIVHEISEIRKLAQAWDSLAESFGQTGLMQTSGYYLSYFESLRKNAQFEFIVAVYRGVELRAVLPLSKVLKKRLFLSVKILQLPDTPIPVRGMLWPPDWSLDDLHRLLRQLHVYVAWDLVKLGGFIQDELSQLVGKEVASPFAIRAIAINNFIQLDFDDYGRDVLAKKMRSNLKRGLARLKALGEVEFVTVCDQSVLDHAFDQFVALEASGWKSQRGGKRAIALHPDQLEFYRNLMKRFARSNRCDIHLLLINKEPVAADFCVISGASVYWLKHGFNERYTDASPGQLLRKYVIDRYSQHPDVTRYDMISSYSWQKVWKPTSREVIELQAINRTLIGSIVRAAYYLKKTIRRSH